MTTDNDPKLDDQVTEPLKRAREMTIEERAAFLIELGKKFPASMQGISFPRKSPYKS